MSMAKKMAQRTAAIEADSTRKTAEQTDRPVTSTGRLLDVQLRVNAAEDRATAAAQEAANAKDLLDDAMRQIEDLKSAKADSAGATNVEIATLVEVPGRRRVLSPNEYAELRDNLLKNPLVHPIVYRPLGDGRNEIVSGSNRVSIYRDDGRTHILGMPFSGDAKSAELGATFANLLAPSLPDYEKFRQFVRLQTESGFSRAEIIDASGLSSTHIYRILAFEKLPQRAQDAIARRPDRVGGHAAEDFAALAANGKADAVIEAIEALIADEKMTQKQALDLINPKSAKASPATAKDIKVGKKKLCAVSVRGGVIALRFPGKEGDANAAEWAEKIEQFLLSQLAEQ